MTKSENCILRGKELKKLREENGLSQRQLGELCGIPHRLIQSYEQGTKDTKNMTVETFFRLSRGLNIPLDNLSEQLFHNQELKQRNDDFKIGE